MKFAYPSGSKPLEGFTIKRGVGIGGFGEVYFATSDAGKEVALKRVQRNLDVELRGVRQCLNLKHGNLIGLYDIRYDDEGGAWVVMEYVAGESLKDLLERNPEGLPRDQALRVFRQICEGVAYLHDQGIVHRDLKPGNIFIEGEDVKIGDYGLSKFISCSRRSGQTESVGTFHYMAPEIGKGVYGKEIDIYALGIMLFEVLTGGVPFDGETSQEIMMKHLTADPELQNLGQPYRSMVQRCLYKDPARRFPSVRDMLARLNGSGDVEVIDEPPVDATSVDGTVEVSAIDVVEPTQTPRVPPVVKPPRRGGSDNSEPMYIGDDEEPASADDIVFGPMRERSPRNGGRRPPTRLQAVPVRATSSEPVARAVQSGVNRGVRWWQHGKVSTPLKVLALFAVVFLLLMNAEWLLPAAIFCGAAYLIYFGVRTLIVSLNERQAAKAAAAAGGNSHQNVVRQAAGPSGRRAQLPRHRVPLEKRARQVLHQKPAGDRVSELTGSYLMSALVAGALSFVLMLLAGQSIDGSVRTWGLFAWMALSSVAGAWTLLTLGKFWEGSNGDSIVRRFTTMLSGLVVGGLAYASNKLLMVDLSEAPVVHLPVSMPLPDSLSSAMFAADGGPLLPAYLVFFGGLFAILGWWKQVDPLRKSRLSLFATAGCALWSWILTMFLQFPQPWGFMLAITIAISVQLASPWIGVDERERLAQRYREA